MQKSRIVYFDYLNVFSCLSVIALHCNGIFHNYTRDGLWILSAVIQVLFYCAVPIFFMLSGATLLEYGKRYSTKEFYQKRIKKTIVPYIVFSVVFYILHIVGKYIKDGGMDYSVLEFLQMLVSGSVPHTNFWFFIPLFMFYLFIPFLSYIATSASKNKLMFLIGIMIFFAGIYPVIAEYLGFNSIITPIYGYGALYGFLGYFLHKYDFEKNNCVLVTVCLVGLAAFAVRLILLLQYADCKIDLLMTYFGLYAIVPSMALFMLFKRLFTKNREIVTHLSALSFGVFLIQAAIIQIAQAGTMKLGLNDFFMQTIGIVLVYVICCLIVYIARKISLFRWIFP